MRRNGFRRVALVGLAVSGIVLTCLPVLAACGDGVVEGTEQCDDGSANGTDGCCSASCTLVDRDGDGLCDALDSCDLGNGLRIKETKLVALAEAEQLTPGDGTNEGRSVHGPVRYVPCSAKYRSAAWAASSRSQNMRSSGSPRWHGPTGGGPMHATLSPDALKSQWVAFSLK